MRKTTSTNAMNLAELADHCPMQYGMELIGGRWKLALLFYIHKGLNRFSRLQKRLPAITSKMLTQQLKELEADELISRTIYPEMPPRVEYALLPKAEQMVGLLDGFYAWGESLKQAALEKAKTDVND